VACPYYLRRHGSSHAVSTERLHSNVRTPKAVSVFAGHRPVPEPESSDRKRPKSSPPSTRAALSLFFLRCSTALAPEFQGAGRFFAGLLQGLVGKHCGWSCCPICHVTLSGTRPSRDPYQSSRAITRWKGSYDTGTEGNRWQVGRQRCHVN
jgi:hypothetical protein